MHMRYAASSEPAAAVLMDALSWRPASAYHQACTDLLCRAVANQRWLDRTCACIQPWAADQECITHTTAVEGCINDKQAQAGKQLWTLHHDVVSCCAMPMTLSLRGASTTVTCCAVPPSALRN